MALKFSNLTWHGRATLKGEGRICDLQQEIPWFTEEECRIEEHENEYVKLIAREPLDLSYHPAHREHVPVSIVSKDYKLVQHTDVLQSMLTALANYVTNSQSLEAELILSKYSARMKVTLLLPNYTFNPGDGFPIMLTLTCLNSMDRKFAVRIHPAWYRKESDTEIQGREIRIPHNLPPKAVMEEIEKFLKDQFKHIQTEQNLYREWYETQVDWNQLVRWLNDDVAKKWFPVTGVRAYYIAKTGYDIEIDQVFCINKNKKGDIKIEEVKLGRGPLALEKFDFITNYTLYNGVLPAFKVREGSNSVKKFIDEHTPPIIIEHDPFFSGHNDKTAEQRSKFVQFVTDHMAKHNKARFLTIKKTCKVPALFTPIENIYHVSQVLSWLASKQVTIEGKLNRIRQIHELMDALLRKEKKLRLRISRLYK